MDQRKPLRTGILLSIILLSLPGAGWVSAQEKATTEPLPVEVREDIRVVYQINTDDWKDGVGKGLLYLKKLTDAYEKMGITEKDRAISAVFHGKAGYWMLNDKAFAAFRKADGENPNKELIAALDKAGVSIELCDETRKSHGWKPEDLLPQVQTVVGAYPRIIDLQMQGYAYIRF
jgi:intracellular sulfur oxidation DsrE/DsrF family protein